MKPRLSPLLLLDFVVMETRLKVIHDRDIDYDAKSVFDYDLDIDFFIRQHDDHFSVFMKVHINETAQPKVGYSIFVECVASYQFNAAEKQTAAEKKSLMAISSISMTIGSLRAFISQLTATSIHGSYLLPPIDIQDLLAQKAQQKREKSN
ncbi:MAG: hypothetical protein ACRCYO_07375 [Bacteroidia bacterium]